MGNALRKSKPTAADVAAAKRLRAAWDVREDRSLTQESMGVLLGSSQGAVSQYLNGKIPLNYRALLHFAKALGVDPLEIRDDLPEQQVAAARAVNDSVAPYSMSQPARLDPAKVVLTTRALLAFLRRRNPDVVLDLTQAAAAELFAEVYEMAAGVDDELELGAAVADFMAAREAKRGSESQSDGGAHGTGARRAGARK